MLWVGHTSFSLKSGDSVCTIFQPESFMRLSRPQVEPCPKVKTQERKVDLWPAKAEFILRTQIYAVYADHFARAGCAPSATNADLRRSDRAYVKYEHSYNTPTFTLTFARLLKLCCPGNSDAGLSLANSPRPLRIRPTQAFTQDIK